MLQKAKRYNSPPSYQKRITKVSEKLSQDEPKTPILKGFWAFVLDAIVSETYHKRIKITLRHFKNIKKSLYLKAFR